MTSPGGNVVTIRVVTEDKAAAGFASAQANVGKTQKAAAGLGTELDRTATKAKGLGGVLRDIGTVAAGVLVADTLQAGARKVLAFAQSSVKAASDLGESVNAVSKIFGDQTTRVLEWGKANANAIGLSTRAFNQLATPLGAMLKNSGLAMDDVADHTIKLTERAADMASVFNVDVSEALTAIQAGLRGESDPLEQFGVGLSAAAVEARALADTGKTAAASLTEQEKALARLAIIYDQTNDTAGDFRSTSDGLANSQRIATAQMEEAQAKIGSAFIPVMAKAAQVAGGVAEAFSSMSGSAQLATAAVLAIGAGMVILAPKILAAKAALDQMLASSNRFTQVAGRVAVVAAKVGTAFVALQVGSAIVSAVFKNDLNPQMDAVATGMDKWRSRLKLSGEAARVFGGDAEKLGFAMQRMATDGFEEAADRASEWLIPALSGLNTSMAKSAELVGVFDQHLAELVRSGHPEEAAAQMEGMARQYNISVDRAREILVAYSGAVEVASKKAGTAATESAPVVVKATKEISTAWRDAHSEFVDVEAAYETALDKLVGKQKLTTKDLIKALQDQVKAQEDWADNMIELSTRVPTAMLEELRAMGPKGAALVALMARMTDKELQKVVALWAKGGSAAGDAFARELRRKAGAIYSAAVGIAQTAANVFNRVFGRNIIEVPHPPGGGAGGYSGYASGGISGAAAGGAQGGMRWVGEQGPELVRLPYGSMVYSHGDSERMAATGGGGQMTVNLVVSGGAGEFEAFMAKFLRRFVHIEGGGDANTAFGRAPTRILAQS